MVASREPFRYELKQDGGVMELHLYGYVDAESAQRYLTEVESAMKEIIRVTSYPAVGLMLIGSVSGFDASRTAQLHGEWFKRMGSSISRIAIVSSRTTTTLAISVLRLATKHPMRQFDTREEARLWLTGT